MPMQQNPNNRRRGEERNETLIIPHITKEMVETARRMAERGASRAEIEQAIAAMQAGKTPTEAESAAQKKPIVQPQAAAAPARNTAAHSDTVIIPTSRPRYTAAERRAMLEEVQRRQAEREAERQKLAREEESHFRTYRDREYGTNPLPTRPAPCRSRRPNCVPPPRRRLPRHSLCRPHSSSSRKALRPPRLCRKRSPSPLCLRPRLPRSAAARSGCPAPTPRPKPL